MLKNGICTMIDVRNACCYDTLTSPINKAIKEMKPDEVLDIVVNPSFKGEFNKFIDQSGHEILEETSQDDEINYRIRPKSNKQEQERKNENCMVCDGFLEYLDGAVSVVCNYCGKEDTGYVRCPQGHYVCDECHGKGAFDMIKDIALSTDEKDPLVIAELLMNHPEIPFLGCEHGLIASASLLSALRNEGSLEVSVIQIFEAMTRTQKQSMPIYCALTGVCGVPIGIGAAFSVITGAACPKDRESAITMHIVGRTINTIANDVGPMCCKSFVRTALGVGYNAAKEYFDVHLPLHRERISCFHSSKNHPNCRKEKCLYFPKTV